MLRNAKVHPTISVVDLEKSKNFYSKILGLKELPWEIENHVQYEAGSGTLLTIYLRADPPKAENTTASFQVDDVESVVNELKKKEVQFEEYDFPGLKTINSVAAMGDKKGAWFKDPSGNILAISNTW